VAPLIVSRVRSVLGRLCTCKCIRVCVAPFIRLALSPLQPLARHGRLFNAIILRASARAVREAFISSIVSPCSRRFEIPVRLVSIHSG